VGQARLALNDQAAMQIDAQEQMKMLELLLTPLGNRSNASSPMFSGSDAMGMAGGAMSLFAMSDRRLKENIQHIETTEDGIKLYEFNYPGNRARLKGVMADEIEQMPLYAHAVHYQEDGFARVDYNELPVCMTFAGWREEFDTFDDE
jgi:hypothetical protein